MTSPMESDGLLSGHRGGADRRSGYDQRQNEDRRKKEDRRQYADRRKTPGRRKEDYDPTYRKGDRRITERRRANGPFFPTLYLMLELILILQLIYIVHEIHLQWLYLAAAALGMFYFVFSCLPRYRRVLARQKLYLSNYN